MKTSKGESKFNHLNDLGFEYRLSFPDSTIFYCEQAYELGKQLNIEIGMSRPLSFIGLANAYKGDYKASFDYHNKAISIAEEERDSSQLAFGYNNFGRLFFDQGDLVRAYNNFLKARVIFEKIDDKYGLSYVNRSLSNLYKSQHDYDKALRMAIQAYELRKDLGDPRGMLSALMELGLVYEEINDTVSAISSLHRADSIANSIDDKISHAEIYLALSEILLDQHQLEDACVKALEANNIIEATDNQRLRPKGNLLLGKCTFEKRDYPKSIAYFNDVVTDAEKTGNLQLQQDANYYLSKIYQNTHNNSKAIEHSNRYLILRESLQNVDLTRQIERLQFQLEIEKKEKENELLLANKKANEAIISQQRLQNILLVIVIVFISTMAFFQWRNSKRNKDVNERLSIQNIEIQKQREEIVRQNEKLSKRNQELSELNNEKDTLMSIVAHDLKSPLNRIKGLSDIIDLENSLTEEQKTYVNLIKVSTNAGLDLIKDLLDVHMLEENEVPHYSTFNIHTFIHSKIESLKQLADKKGISLILNETAREDVNSDVDYVERIVDNLATNAIKFSKSESSIEIGVGKSGNSFWIRIKDYGPGFSDHDKSQLFQKFKKLSAKPTEGESSNGLGLAIVKILVDRLGGTILLNSELKKGSEFLITFPDNRPVVA